MAEAETCAPVISHLYGTQVLNLNATAVARILQNPNIDKISSNVPKYPKGGEIYIVQITADNPRPWAKDGYRWLNCSTRALPTNQPLLRKTFYRPSQEGPIQFRAGFSKYVFRPLVDCINSLALVHYVGDESLSVIRPHKSQGRKRAQFLQTVVGAEATEACIYGVSRLPLDAKLVRNIFEFPNEDKISPIAPSAPNIGEYFVIKANINKHWKRDKYSWRNHMTALMPGTDSVLKATFRDKNFEKTRIEKHVYTQMSDKTTIIVHFLDRNWSLPPGNQSHSSEDAGVDQEELQKLLSCLNNMRPIGQLNVGAIEAVLKDPAQYSATYTIPKKPKTGELYMVHITHGHPPFDGYSWTNQGVHMLLPSDNPRLKKHLYTSKQSSYSNEPMPEERYVYRLIDDDRDESVALMHYGNVNAPPASHGEAAMAMAHLSGGNVQSYPGMGQSELTDLSLGFPVSDEGGNLTVGLTASALQHNEGMNSSMQDKDGHNLLDLSVTQDCANAGKHVLDVQHGTLEIAHVRAILQNPPRNLIMYNQINTAEAGQVFLTTLKRDGYQWRNNSTRNYMDLKKTYFTRMVRPDERLSANDVLSKRVYVLDHNPSVTLVHYLGDRSPRLEHEVSQDPMSMPGFLDQNEMEASSVMGAHMANYGPPLAEGQRHHWSNKVYSMGEGLMNTQMMNFEVAHAPQTSVADSVSMNGQSHEDGASDESAEQIKQRSLYATLPTTLEPDHAIHILRNPIQSKVNVYLPSNPMPGEIYLVKRPSGLSDGYRWKNDTKTESDLHTRIAFSRVKDEVEELINPNPLATRHVFYLHENPTLALVHYLRKHQRVLSGLDPHTAGQEETIVYTQDDGMLSPKFIEDTLTNPDVSKVNANGPRQPQAGEVYLVKFPVEQNTSRKSVKVIDGYSWLNDGTYTCLNLRKTYFHRSRETISEDDPNNNPAFSKRVYSLNDNHTYVIVHYLGSLKYSKNAEATQMEKRIIYDTVGVALTVANVEEIMKEPDETKVNNFGPQFPRAGEVYLVRKSSNRITDGYQWHNDSSFVCGNVKKTYFSRRGNITDQTDPGCPLSKRLYTYCENPSLLLIHYLGSTKQSRREVLPSDPQAVDQNCTIYSNSTDGLDMADVEAILKNPDKSKLNTEEPCFPLSGEIYLIDTSKATKNMIGYAWRNETNVVCGDIKKTYYYRKEAPDETRHPTCPISKRMYRFINDDTNIALIHFLGKKSAKGRRTRSDKDSSLDLDTSAVDVTNGGDECILYARHNNALDVDHVEEILRKIDQNKVNYCFPRTPRAGECYLILKSSSRMCDSYTWHNDSSFTCGAVKKTYFSRRGDIHDSHSRKCALSKRVYTLIDDPSVELVHYLGKTAQSRRGPSFKHMYSGDDVPDDASLIDEDDEFDECIPYTNELAPLSPQLIERILENYDPSKVNTCLPPNPEAGDVYLVRKEVSKFHDEDTWRSCQSTDTGNLQRIISWRMNIGKSDEANPKFAHSRRIYHLNSSPKITLLQYLGQKAERSVAPERTGADIVYGINYYNLDSDYVEKILENPDEDKVNALPPCEPKGGEIYVFKNTYGTSDDGYLWKNDNRMVRGKLTKTHYNLRKKYSVDFVKQLFSSENKPDLALVHYIPGKSTRKMGDETLDEPANRVPLDIVKLMERNTPLELEEIAGLLKNPPADKIVDCGPLAPQSGGVYLIRGHSKFRDGYFWKNDGKFPLKVTEMIKTYYSRLAKPDDYEGRNPALAKQKYHLMTNPDLALIHYFGTRRGDCTIFTHGHTSMLEITYVKDILEDSTASPINHSGPVNPLPGEIYLMSKKLSFRDGYRWDKGIDSHIDDGDVSLVVHKLDSDDIGVSGQISKYIYTHVNNQEFGLVHYMDDKKGEGDSGDANSRLLDADAVSDSDPDFDVSKAAEDDMSTGDEDANNILKTIGFPTRRKRRGRRAKVKVFRRASKAPSEEQLQPPKPIYVVKHQKPVLEINLVSDILSNPSKVDEYHTAPKNATVGEVYLLAMPVGLDDGHKWKYLSTKICKGSVKKRTYVLPDGLHPEGITVRSVYTLHANDVGLVHYSCDPDGITEKPQKPARVETHLLDLSFVKENLDNPPSHKISPTCPTRPHGGTIYLVLLSGRLKDGYIWKKDHENSDLRSGQIVQTCYTRLGDRNFMAHQEPFEKHIYTLSNEKTLAIVHYIHYDTKQQLGLAAANKLSVYNPENDNGMHSSSAAADSSRDDQDNEVDSFDAGSEETPEVQLYGMSKHQLRTSLVKTMIENPNMTKISTTGPTSPTVGQIYLIVPGPSGYADNYDWTKVSEKVLPEDQPSVKQVIFEMKNPASNKLRSLRKLVCTLPEDKSLVLVHYIDESGLESRRHTPAGHLMEKEVSPKLYDVTHEHLSMEYLTDALLSPKRDKVSVVDPPQPRVGEVYLLAHQITARTGQLMWVCEATQLLPDKSPLIKKKLYRSHTLPTMKKLEPVRIVYTLVKDPSLSLVHFVKPDSSDPMYTACEASMPVDVFDHRKENLDVWYVNSLLTHPPSDKVINAIHGTPQDGEVYLVQRLGAIDEFQWESECVSKIGFIKKVNFSCQSQDSSLDAPLRRTTYCYAYNNNFFIVHYQLELAHATLHKEPSPLTEICGKEEQPLGLYAAKTILDHMPANMISTTCPKTPQAGEYLLVAGSDGLHDDYDWERADGALDSPPSTEFPYRRKVYMRKDTSDENNVTCKHVHVAYDGAPLALVHYLSDAQLGLEKVIKPLRTELEILRAEQSHTSMQLRFKPPKEWTFIKAGLYVTTENSLSVLSVKDFLLDVVAERKLITRKPVDPHSGEIYLRELPTGQNAMLLKDGFQGWVEGAGEVESTMKAACYMQPQESDQDAREFLKQTFYYITHPYIMLVHYLHAGAIPASEINNAEEEGVSSQKALRDGVLCQEDAPLEFATVRRILNDVIYRTLLTNYTKRPQCGEVYVMQMPLPRDDGYEWKLDTIQNIRVVKLKRYEKLKKLVGKENMAHLAMKKECYSLVAAGDSGWTRRSLPTAKFVYTMGLSPRVAVVHYVGDDPVEDLCYDESAPEEGAPEERSLTHRDYHYEHLITDNSRAKPTPQLPAESNEEDMDASDDVAPDDADDSIVEADSSQQDATPPKFNISVIQKEDGSHEVKVTGGKKSGSKKPRQQEVVETPAPPKSKTFKCCMCPKVCEKEEDLKKHLQSYHNVLNLPNDCSSLVICNLCAKIFRHEQFLIKHLRVMHRIDKPIIPKKEDDAAAEDALLSEEEFSKKWRRAKSAPGRKMSKSARKKAARVLARSRFGRPVTSTPNYKEPEVDDIEEDDGTAEYDGQAPITPEKEALLESVNLQLAGLSGTSADYAARRKRQLPPKLPETDSTPEPKRRRSFRRPSAAAKWQKAKPLSHFGRNEPELSFPGILTDPSQAPSSLKWEKSNKGESPSTSQDSSVDLKKSPWSRVPKKKLTKKRPLRGETTLVTPDGTVIDFTQEQFTPPKKQAHGATSILTPDGRTLDYSLNTIFCADTPLGAFSAPKKPKWAKSPPPAIKPVKPPGAKAQRKKKSKDGIPTSLPSGQGPLVQVSVTSNETGGDEVQTIGANLCKLWDQLHDDRLRQRVDLRNLQHQLESFISTNQTLLDRNNTPTMEAPSSCSQNYMQLPPPPMQASHHPSQNYMQPPPAMHMHHASHNYMQPSVPQTIANTQSLNMGTTNAVGPDPGMLATVTDPSGAVRQVMIPVVQPPTYINY